MNTENSSALLYNALHGRRRRMRPPCICPGGMMNMITSPLMELGGVGWPEAHWDPDAMADLACLAWENGLFDNIGVPFCMTVEAEAMGAGVDLGDRTKEPRVTEYPLSSVSGFEGRLRPIDMESGRPRVVLEALHQIRERHPDAAVMANLTGPISTASSLVEANHVYRDLRRSREDSHALLSFVTGQLIAFGRAQILAGAGFVTVSDPSGTGEILGPKLFEEYALPYLNRICRDLSPLCGGVIVHICGQLRSIYPLLPRLECDALSVDAVVNLKSLRELLPEKAIMGNVSTFALAGGDHRLIRTLSRNSLKNGADILAPACGLGTTTSVESIRQMRQAAEEAGTKHRTTADDVAKGGTGS